ncbi:MaoC family dehydratase N-terminal domain-containing protein [Salicibibacter cibi]|uniref:MaoC family dehydratase N-terminal domain-containing protein n=1 Tax=Salicibibacter cibi TaxID=2743001 RepID=A0A7T6ZBJ7_9BACI|nr:MaoC family dehydratase N-terminal domain-containing protein [Salicibibacter cibi]QQK80491.1 MaoC family dehydratase N-terminal domain-containing protein [Salicibibacter cibi]
MFEDAIGNLSNKVKNTVERGAVRKFADAIGDAHPIFVDEEAGKTSRYGRNIAPPTFPRVFDYGEIAGLELPNKGLIHGEQIYHYERPLLVGEDIHCWTEVKDYKEKAGKSGTMGILSLEGKGEDQGGNLVFRAEQVVIITEAVRRGMEA